MTVTAKPDAREFESQMSDPTRLTEMNQNGKIGEFVKDYADARIAELGADISRKVKDETDRSVAEFLKETGGIKRLPQHEGTRSDRKSALEALAKGKGAAYNMKAPGATIDNDDSAPEDFTEFLQAIWHHRNSLVNSDELDAKRDKWKKIQNSFGSVVPADGGFLIPEELRSDLLQLALENSIIRSRATVIPMSSLAVPIPSVDETSRVSSLRGGVVAYWTEEGAAITESQASFGQVRLLSKKLTAYCEAPNELISDAPAFSSFLSSTLPEAIAFEEDYAFFTGSGVGEPLGVLDAGSTGTIATTRTASGLSIEFADIINVFVRLLPGSYSKAVWVCSPATVANLLSMVNIGGTSPVWLGGGQVDGASGAPPMSILGRPLFVSEKVPTLGTRGDLGLYDFSHYLIGDRQIIQASSSPHFKFSSDKTAYKILERVDGRPWVTTALTPRNNGDTLSPYVTVAT
jgi:HK97 family phage major capsid protein